MAEEKNTTAAEPDPNVIPLPRNLKSGMIGKLRGGMMIQTGSDSNDPDSFIHGPADVPLTPALAIAHMSKWANCNEIKFWLHDNYPKLVDGKPHLAPRTNRRLTPGERLDRTVDQAREINEQRGTLPGAHRAREYAAPRESMTAEDIAAIAGQAAADVVSAAVAPMVKAINQLSAAIGVEGITAPELKASPAKVPPVRRAAPAARSRRRGR